MGHGNRSEKSEGKRIKTGKEKGKMLKDALKKQNTEEWITNGREKISLDEAIAETNGRMTIREAEIVEDKKKNREYAIVVCDELEGRFFFVGSVMVALIQRFDSKLGTHEAFSAALKEEGLPVLIEKKRSEKTGNVYTSVSII